MKSRSEEFAGELQKLMEELESWLKRSSETPEAGPRVADIRARLERLRDEFGALKTEIPRAARQAAGSVDQLVRRDPWSSLAIVAAVAFACGLALSRRQ